MQRKLYVFENLDLDINGSSFLFIVWGICAGILLGVLLSLIYRVHAHKLVTALAEHEALDREHALTLDGLGLAKNRVIRRMLGENGSMTSIVACANEDEFPPLPIPSSRATFTVTPRPIPSRSSTRRPALGPATSRTS